jgi:selenocysteine lyase/cysteine desulfurase
MNNWVEAWKRFLEENQELNIGHWELPSIPDESRDMLSTNEEFWKVVRSHFPVSDKIINFNSGAVSSSSYMVEKAFTSYYQILNQVPSYYLWKVMEKSRELIREGVATLINADKEEVAFARNTTEALNNLIFGIDLKEGDEVVACRQDYIKCVTSWKQREIREGIKINWVELGGPEESDEEIVKKYVNAISEKTKLLHLTHVINWNGQVLPVEKIISEAKKRNVEVLLDGAHSFALLETDMKKLDCDYFGTALHKWLSGPIPSGMIYIKKDKIRKTWPLASAIEPKSENIRKFEELSIQLVPHILGLGYAMEYYHWLGRDRKEARLRHIRRVIISGIENLPGLSFVTPLEEERCCVIINIAIEGWEPAALEAELLKRFNIHVNPVLWENMRGIRITANIYNSPEEIKKIISGLKEISENKMLLLHS